MIFKENDTIAAISTGMTTGGIGIIRISGEDALDVGNRIFRNKEGEKTLLNVRKNSINYGFIYDGDELIDEVLISVMKAPHTFTAEDTVEINCHGGILVMKKILDVVLQNGARIAEPGEFTKRAFLNGRIDLSQAEAVMDLINSDSEYAMKSSLGQLKGGVKKEIKKIRDDILFQMAYIESAIDDPEHYDLDGYSDELKSKIQPIINKIKKMTDTSEEGRLIKEGIMTVIIGKPNVGKSSLLNVLSGSERAIVTDIAGTTRDVLEEKVTFSGISLRILDTAGIRDTDNMIEKIGVDKAREYANKADLILHVIDADDKLKEINSSSNNSDSEKIDDFEVKKRIIIINKSDLLSEEEIDTVLLKIKNENKNVPVVIISAKEEKGIDKLTDTIKRMFFKGEIKFDDKLFITNARQKELLLSASESMKLVLESIENEAPEDFYTIDLMDAYETLGKIIGEDVGEDLVNEIFAKFCMGK